MEKSLEVLECLDEIAHTDSAILFDPARLEAALADVLKGRCKAERAFLMKFIDDGMALIAAVRAAAEKADAWRRYLDQGQTPMQEAGAWIRAMAGEKAAVHGEALRFLAELYAGKADNEGAGCETGNADAGGTGCRPASGDLALQRPAGRIGSSGDAAHRIKAGERYLPAFGSWKGEALSWHVIDVRDGRAMLLLARDQLDWMPYHAKDESVTWETCSLRKWLNEEFYRKAFSAAEKERILQVTVPAYVNTETFTDPGRDTEDRVFLLSMQEFRKLLKEEDLRIFGKPGVRNGKWWWWLRSPGSDPASAASVYDDGTLNHSGQYVFCDYFAVRPALWIETSGLCSGQTDGECADGNESGGSVDAAEKKQAGPQPPQAVHANAGGTGFDDSALLSAAKRLEISRKKQPPCLGHWKGKALSWHVIDVRGGMAMLLLAEDQLGHMPYHAKLKDVTWEACSLRKWLNEEFYQKAFSDAEKERILQVTVPAHVNPMESTDPGRDTEDRVFLLSVQEYHEVLTKKKLRVFRQPGHDDPEQWWLRSPGFYRDYAAFVSIGGSLCSRGNSVDSGSYAVRPALWIHL